MKKKPSIKTALHLSTRLHDLHMERKAAKQKIPRTTKLSKVQRQLILEKTAAKCHICGQDLSIDNFQADHVKSHTTGGTGKIDNFLPSCTLCNNYRWHYLPEELHWILKLGVWAKTQVEKQTTIGNAIGDKFVKKELQKERNNINRKK